MNIVNSMRELRIERPIDLEALHRLLPHSKLYRGRPQMLIVKMTCGRNLQLFPRGCIQILGPLSHSEALSMAYEILPPLRHLYPQLQMPKMILKNLVVCARLNKAVSLHRLKYCSRAMAYEPELFPAILIRQLHPVHVAVFHTGRCVLTGLTSMEQAETIVNQLVAYLTKKDLM